MEYKNNLILEAATGKTVSRPPIWMMRQAGRVLPEYKKVRDSFPDFKAFVKNPQAAAEVTVQPIDFFGVDAAIIFSDILVIAEAMGLDYEMIESKGPRFPKTIKNTADILALSTLVEEKLEYVPRAIEVTQTMLQGRVPVIGFAGAPWTIFAYMIEGSGSKTFSKPRSWLYANPEGAHLLLQKITDATILYLRMQIQAGAAMLQLFDSWAGVLSPQLYRTFAIPYFRQICAALPQVPITIFAKDAGFALEDLATLPCQVIGLDWTMDVHLSRKRLGNNYTLQGNLDPCVLYADEQTITLETQKMLSQFGIQKYICNLGHGLYPDMDRFKIKHFVDVVKNFVL